MVFITKVSTVASVGTWLLGYLEWGDMAEQLHDFLYCDQSLRSLPLILVGRVSDISFLNEYMSDFKAMTQQQKLVSDLPSFLMWSLLSVGIACLGILLLYKISKDKEKLNKDNHKLQKLLQEKEQKYLRSQHQLEHEVSTRLMLERQLKETQEQLNKLNESASQAICERQKIEAELKSRLQQQSVAAQLGHRGLEGIDLSLLMDEAMTLVAETLKVDFAHVLELLPNATAFFVRAGVGWKKGIVRAASVSAQADSQAGYTLSVNEPVVIEDLLIETRFSNPPLLLNHHIISGVSLGISGKKNSFGVLGVYTKQKRHFSQDDIHFLQAIANILATAIERKQAEERLHLLERAIDASSNGIVIADAIQTDNPIIYVNKTFERLTGYQSQEVLGKNCRFLQADDHDQPTLAYLRQKIAEGQDCQVILRNYRKDGTRFWNELHIAPVHSPEGYLTHYIGIQTDITERKRAEEALRESEHRINSILGSLKDIVWSVSAKDFTTLYVNAAAEKVYGFSLSQFFSNSQIWLDVVYPEDQERVRNSTQFLIETGSKDLEYRIVRPDGEIRWLHDRGRVIYDENGVAIRFDGIATDITERKRMEEQLLHDAFHDSLTGLPNRALFMDHLREALEESKRDRNYLFAVLFLDLDRFKVVNDSVGHGIGDKLLVAIARQLEKFVSPTDIVARLGGDEFSILLKNIN
ncbi:MAG: PAS domain S-box protein, partial [Chroococcales cyanobacterium]